MYHLYPKLRNLQQGTYGEHPADRLSKSPQCRRALAELWCLFGGYEPTGERIRTRSLLYTSWRRFRGHWIRMMDPGPPGPLQEYPYRTLDLVKRVLAKRFESARRQREQLDALESGNMDDPIGELCEVCLGTGVGDNERGECYDCDGRGEV